jgi:hydrogenase maturation protease
MIAVIGCGNSNRQDDGVGPSVVRALLDRRLDERFDGVRLIDAGTDGIAAMFAAKGCQSLIIVDACRSGSVPGAIFEAPGAELERQRAPGLTLHDFRWDDALYAGRKMFRDAFPSDIIILLIEAETVDYGIGLSPAVAMSAAKVADRIEAIVGARAWAKASKGVTIVGVTVQRGSLHIARKVYDRYLPGVETVALLRRDDDLVILPLRSALAGGYLLKIRNSAGDRVVNAPDFFSANGFNSPTSIELAVEWTDDDAALVGARAFRVQT